jgi:hypothetical protein
VDDECEDLALAAEADANRVLKKDTIALADAKLLLEASKGKIPALKESVTALSVELEGLTTELVPAVVGNARLDLLGRLKALEDRLLKAKDQVAAANKTVASSETKVLRLTARVEVLEKVVKYRKYPALMEAQPGFRLRLGTKRALDKEELKDFALWASFFFSRPSAIHRAHRFAPAEAWDSNRWMPKPMAGVGNRTNQKQMTQAQRAWRSLLLNWNSSFPSRKVPLFSGKVDKAAGPVKTESKGFVPSSPWVAPKKTAPARPPSVAEVKASVWKAAPTAAAKTVTPKAMPKATITELPPSPPQEKKGEASGPSHKEKKPKGITGFVKAHSDHPHALNTSGCVMWASAGPKCFVQAARKYCTATCKCLECQELGRLHVPLSVENEEFTLHREQIAVAMWQVATTPEADRQPTLEEYLKDLSKVDHDVNPKEYPSHNWMVPETWSPDWEPRKKVTRPFREVRSLLPDDLDIVVAKQLCKPTEDPLSLTEIPQAYFAGCHDVAEAIAMQMQAEPREPRLRRKDKGKVPERPTTTRLEEVAEKVETQSENPLKVNAAVGVARWKRLGLTPEQMSRLRGVLGLPLPTEGKKEHLVPTPHWAVEGLALFGEPFLTLIKSGHVTAKSYVGYKREKVSEPKKAEAAAYSRLITEWATAKATFKGVPLVKNAKTEKEKSFLSEYQSLRDRLAKIPSKRNFLPKLGEARKQKKGQRPPQGGQKDQPSSKKFYWKKGKKVWINNPAPQPAAPNAPAPAAAPPAPSTSDMGGLDSLVRALKPFIEILGSLVNAVRPITH